MVDRRALAVAAAVVGGAVLLFLASFVLRLVARVLAWSVLLLLALGVGYAVYQLYSGWSAAADAGPADDLDADTDVEAVKDRYAEGELSDAELEAELEDAVGAGDGVETDREPERER